MSNVLSSRGVRFALCFAFTAIILVILVSHFLNVFIVPLCCADDEAMAVVAKNFAFGNGYAMSAHYSGNPGLYPFDPGITTGPTLLIPAAVLIKLFGNLAWVPGLATIGTIVLLSLWITVLVSKYASVLQGLIFTAVLLLIVNSLVGPYAWANLLGEIPSALYCVVAIIIWSRNPDSIRRLAFASFVFGLAALTKLLATLCFAPLGMWLTYELLTKPSKGATLKRMVVSIACFLVPLLAFELFKMASLGPREYLTLVSDLGSFVGHMAAPGASVDILGRVNANIDGFYSHFKIVPMFLVAIEIVGVFLITTSDRISADTKRRYYMLVAAAALNWVWFFAASVGWPRYITLGLVLDAAAIAGLASAFFRSRLAAFALVALLAHLPTPLANLVRTREAFDVLVTKNDRVAHLESAAAFVETLPKDNVLVSGWWPSISGLEFLLPTADNFVQFDRIKPELIGRPMLLVRNSTWTKGDYENSEFNRWESACSEVIFDQAPYMVSRCPPPNADSAKNLKLALENVVSAVTPPPALRVVAGGWDIFAHAPTTLRLPVEQGRTELEVGFGMDSVTWTSKDDLKTDGVCFAIAAVDATGGTSEIMRKCLAPLGNVADRVEQELVVPVPPLTESLLLKTESVSTTYYDWSHWSKLKFR
jgi:hypothetical protein